ncbi:MAG: alpha/beta fold hydrolase, partial [Actinobacteria bacterium]|nr:alpha/beta fold hydrolase [Actinomycetota bacterium]
MIDPRSPTIVLIHGAGATHTVWDSVVPGLIEFTVFTPDLPGHVAGSGASHDTVAGYADAI